MNNRHWYTQLTFCLLLFVAVPSICSAQLSSASYQVDVYGVGEETAGTATSSQYLIEGAIGPSFQRNPALSDGANETDDPGSRSVRTARDVPGETSPRNPTMPNQESPTQITPESVGNQGLESYQTPEEVPVPSEVTPVPGDSQGDVPTHESIPKESSPEIHNECIGTLACYWRVLLGGLVLLGILILFSRRKFI